METDQKTHLREILIWLHSELVSKLRSSVLTSCCLQPPVLKVKFPDCASQCVKVVCMSLLYCMVVQRGSWLHLTKKGVFESSVGKFAGRKTSLEQTFKLPLLNDVSERLRHLVKESLQFSSCILWISWLFFLLQMHHFNLREYLCCHSHNFTVLLY